VAFKTPEEYLESIQDGRVLYARGEKITNVVTHPLTRPEALHYANDYTRFHREDLRPYFTMEDPERPGHLVDRFMVMPRNAEEILARGRAQEIAHLTHVGATSSFPDSVLALRWVRPLLEEANPMYAENPDHHYRRFLEENLLVAVAMSDVKGDRSLNPGQQPDPDMYVRVVERRPDGVVIRGMKAHITGAPFVHELLIMPTKRMKPEERDYSICCLVPPSAPGVKLIGRAKPEEDRFDHPVGGYAHAGSCFVWLDDVFVPNDRIFQNGEDWLSMPIAYALGLQQRYGALIYKRVEIERILGAMYLVAKLSGLEKVPHVQDKLFEVARIRHLLAGLEQAAARCCTIENGVAIPNSLYANLGKYYGSEAYHTILRHAIDIGGALVANLPWHTEWESPEVGPALRKYLARGDKATGEEVIRAYNYLRDLVADYHANHMGVVALAAEGSLMAQKMMVLMETDFARFEERARRECGILPPLEGIPPFGDKPTVLSPATFPRPHPSPQPASVS
jgi:4-hydroxybutyryl-CoA dehydratase/vinylacetyl-CoA-Delta-isomerase